MDTNFGGMADRAGNASAVAKTLPDNVDRLRRLIKLKNFAIERDLALNPETKSSINTLEAKFFGINPAVEFTDADLNSIDDCILSLQRSARPFTINNIETFLNDSGKIGRIGRLLWLGVLLSFCVGITIYLMKPSSGFHYDPKPVTAILLGMIGAIVYVSLPDGRVNIAAALDEETRVTNTARVLIGGILGFVIFLLVPTIFDSVLDPKPENLKLAFCLVGGYSVSLVVGLLSKVVTAVEMALGLEDHKAAPALNR